MPTVCPQCVGGGGCVAGRGVYCAGAGSAHNSLLSEAAAECDVTRRQQHPAV